MNLALFDLFEYFLDLIFRGSPLKENAAILSFHLFLSEKKLHIGLCVCMFFKRRYFRDRARKD